jgi:hypothetical protein
MLLSIITLRVCLVTHRQKIFVFLMHLVIGIGLFRVLLKVFVLHQCIFIAFFHNFPLMIVNFFIWLACVLCNLIENLSFCELLVLVLLCFLFHMYGQFLLFYHSESYTYFSVFDFILQHHCFFVYSVFLY